MRKKNMTVGVDTQGWPICRDERCSTVELHPPHTIARADIVEDVVFDVRWWKSRTLADAVLAQVQTYEVRVFRQIYAGLLDDYGSLCERRLHRYLRALVLDGQVTRLVLPDGLVGYVRAGSPIRIDDAHELIVTAMLEVRW